MTNKEKPQKEPTFEEKVERTFKEVGHSMAEVHAQLGRLQYRNLVLDERLTDIQAENKILRNLIQSLQQGADERS